MKKLSILAAFALSAALILSGCNPNAEDETADGTETTTETTADAGSSGSSDSSDSGATDANSESGEATQEVKVTTGIFVGDENIAFSKCTIKDAYCGTYDGTTPVVANVPTAGSTGFEVVSGTDDDGNPKDFVKIISVDSDGVLTIAGYSWDKMFITLPEAVDLSAYKTMTITVKVADGFTEDYTKVSGDNKDAFVVEVSSDARESSGVASWTDSAFFGGGSLTTEYKTFSIGLEKFKNLDTNSAYCELDTNYNAIAGSTSAADMTKISGICLNPRGATGNIYIKSIIFE